MKKNRTIEQTAALAAWDMVVAYHRIAPRSPLETTGALAFFAAWRVAFPGSPYGCCNPVGVGVGL